jgi:tripartite-type tricarboxylate transporter receptor subunit TctC
MIFRFGLAVFEEGSVVTESAACRTPRRVAASATMRVAAAMLAAMAIPAPAAQPGATSYPVKPLRLVVAVVPGGNLDLLGRAVAQKLTDGLGRTVIVENRPGANTTVGTEHVVRSAPDGYTLLMIAGSSLVGPLMMRNPPYDPLRDLAAVSLIAKLPQILVVHPSVPVRNVRDLIALAKARPGELNCGTSGNGSGSHFSMEFFNRLAGVRLTRIPYNGDAQALIHVLGGQLPLKFENTSTAIAHVDTGRLRPLGVTSAKRFALVPDVPAIAETLPGFESIVFNGMMAPAGTAKEILARLHAEIEKFAQAPDIRERFLQQGVDLQASASPEAFGAYLRSEHAKLSKLVKELAIAPD